MRKLYVIFIVVVLLMMIPAVLFADQGGGALEIVHVDNAADLVENIGRDNIDLVLSPGVYVLRPCPGGVDQERGQDRTYQTCGQLQQGDHSVLRSDLVLDLDENGVPSGGAVSGAIIDCAGLDGSGLEFSCLVAGNDSVIRNLTIRNGLQTPDPDDVSGDANHRNAIMIVAGKEALVHEVRLVNTRRGVLFTAESGEETRGVVQHSLIEGAELAGVFLWMRSPDGSSTHNARMRAEVIANRITHVGRSPLLYVWAFRGTRNHSHATFIDNVVDSTNVAGNTAGITIHGAGNINSPAQNNTASFDIKGGRLEGHAGLRMSTSGSGSDNSNNTVTGQVDGLTIKNGEPAVEASLKTGWGTHNKALLRMKNSVYINEAGPGEVIVSDGVGSDFRILTTPERFEKENTNFDISNALLGFIE